MTSAQIPRISKENIVEFALAKVESEGISLRAAAKEFNVSFSLLQRRSKGFKPKNLSHSGQQKLTENEEKYLITWIKQLESWGFPPKVSMLVETAEALLAGRDDPEPGTQLSLGKNWPTRFLARHKEMKTLYSRQLDNARAVNNNPTTIKSYFEVSKNALEK